MQRSNRRFQDRNVFPLTALEQIQHVASEVACDAVANLAAEAASDETLKPRWIRAADLVRRMRPYMVYN